MRAVPIACAVVALVAHVAASAEAGRGAGSLRLLADDTRLVIVADVARARSSAVFKKGFEFATDQQPLVGSLKLDKHVDTIVLGSAGASNDHVVVVLEGKVDKLLPDVKKQASATATHAGVTYWTTTYGEVSVIDKRLVLATAGDMTAIIDRAKDKKRTKGPAMVRTLLAASSSTAAIVGGMVPDEALRKDISKQLGAEPRHITFAVGMATQLTFEGRFHLGGDAAAEQAVKALESALSSDIRDRAEGFIGKEFSDSISVDRDHAIARASATMNLEELEKVLALARLLM